MNHQSIFSKESRALLHRPWIIVRILPTTKTYTIARFFNRQDADDHLKLLRRFVPKAVFEIIFEPPETEYQGDDT
ncbi:MULTISPECIES: hypothetical protein [unclassified Nostoc]|uniref:hypothetical protein n=1 Tax=unclassified Nostoc TaxID=2593658 RepID=UPI001D87135F|nr:hypothetical protein [Nostoc sp. JL23]MBN3879592.1 hypothetical protein [Nostoc sp. JL23]